jgi:hypothetical protein
LKFDHSHKKQAYGLRVCDNRVLKILEPKLDGVAGDWRKLSNRERHNYYFLPDISRVVRLVRMGKESM